MRVDTMSADQVNIHVKDGNSKPIRGKLNPDTKQIEWGDGAPSKAVQARAQDWLLKNGKYDIAAAKKQMSILGGTREKEEEGGSGAASKVFALSTLIDIATDQYLRTRVNAMESTTGFHLAIDGSI